MGEAFFLLYGTGPSRVGRVAEGLHQSFAGLIECPQQAFPQLAGRRIFYIKYDEIDPQDVEMFRQQLEQALSTQAWSVKIDADGTPTFHPELGSRTAPPPPAPRRGRTEENDRPPRANHFPTRPYADDYDYGDWEWDWEWDYPGSYSYPSAYNRGDRYEDYPDPHSYRNQRRSSFATDYDRNYGYDDYFEPPPFRNSGRNTHSSNYDSYFAYQAGFEPPPRHQGRRSNTFPSNYGAGYRHHPSHGASRRDPYARTNNHGTHHRDARESHQHRQSSHTHNYDRPVYAGAYQQHGGHPSSRTHGRNGHTDAATPPRDATRAVAHRPKKTMGKRLSRKFWKVVSAFVLCAAVT